MKKILILTIVAFVALFSQNATAQENENVKAGQFMIGTTAGLNLERYNYIFSITPYAEYLIIDRLGLGAQLGCSVHGAGVGTGANAKGVVGVFGAYYVPMARKFYFKPMLEVNLGFTGSGAGVGYEVALVPAFQYFPYKKLSFLLKTGGLSYGDLNADGACLNLAYRMALGFAYSF